MSAIFTDARLRAKMGFGLLIALLALTCSAKAILFDTLDPDCFWHLRVGEQLARHGVGPLVDTLSFESLREPWTPYSWLAEIGMKALWDAGGYRAAVAAQAMLVAGIITLMALAALELCGSGIGAFDSARPEMNGVERRGRFFAVTAATVVGAILSLAYLSFRPASLAIFLLALNAWLLLRDRNRGERTMAAWCVPLITVILVNVHLFAFVVPIWIVALWIGAIWERHRVSHVCDFRPLEVAEELAERFAEATRRVRRYGILLAACVLACLMTPMLGGVLRTIVHYSFADAMVAGPVIAEMRPFYAGAMGKISALLVAIILLCALRNRFRLRAGEWLWLGLSFVLLMQLGRLAPLFALIAVPVLARTMPAMSDRIFSRRAVQGALAAVLLLGGLRLVQAFPDAKQPLSVWVNRHGPTTPGYPCEAADFVANNVKPSTGHLINEFTWGGYLSWRLGDHFQVLLDGRTQLYPTEFWRKTYLGESKETRGFLQQVQADAAIVPVGKSRFRDSLLSLGWRSAHKDDRAEVLLPPETSVANVND